MNLRNIAIATHLVGTFLWMGGAVVIAATAAQLTNQSEGVREAAFAALRRALFTVATPGLVLAWLAGLVWLVPNFTTLYRSAGWMHTKLTLIVVASALTGVLVARVRTTARSDGGSSPVFFGTMGIAHAVVALLIVFLAVLRPF
jgi:putative membrane protein